MTSFSFLVCVPWKGCKLQGVPFIVCLPLDHQDTSPPMNRGHCNSRLKLECRSGHTKRLRTFTSDAQVFFSAHECVKKVASESLAEHFVSANVWRNFVSVGSARDKMGEGMCFCLWSSGTKEKCCWRDPKWSASVMTGVQCATWKIAHLTGTFCASARMICEQSSQRAASDVVFTLQSSKFQLVFALPGAFRFVYECCARKTSEWCLHSERCLCSDDGRIRIKRDRMTKMPPVDPLPVLPHLVLVGDCFSVFADFACSLLSFVRVIDTGGWFQTKTDWQYVYSCIVLLRIARTPEVFKHEETASYDCDVRCRVVRLQHIRVQYNPFSICFRLRRAFSSHRLRLTTPIQNLIGYFLQASLPSCVHHSPLRFI